MKDMKFRIHTPTQCRHIQEVIFELGGSWVASGQNVEYDNYTELPKWLFIHGKSMRKSDSVEGTGDRSHYANANITMLYRMLEEKNEAPKIEENNWYRVSREDKAYGDDALVYYKGGAEGMYGWNYSGNWTYMFSTGTDLKQLDSSRTVTKASEEHVIERFRHEMKSRGFTDYCRFKGSLDNAQGLGSLSQTQFYNDDKNKVMCGEGNGLIFNDGEWAEVVKGGLPRIAGYKGVWDSVNLEVVYGCKRFTKNFILSDGFAMMDSMVVEGNPVKASEMRAVYEFVKANV